MRVLNLLSVALFLLFLAAYCYDVSLNFQNFPISDDYEAFFDFNNRYFTAKDFSAKLGLIFSQHNEHRIATLRIINLSYFYLFGNIDLQSFRLIGLVFFLCSMIFLFLEGEFSLRKFYYFLPIPILMLSFAYAEIYFLAMESLSHFPMIFFTVATFYTAIHKKYNVLPLLFLFLGVFSNGNGILLMPLVFVGLLVQKEYKRLLGWTVFSLLISFIYFHDYESGKSVLKLDIIPYLMKVYPIYIGGIGGFDSLKKNLLLGIFALGLIMYFAVFRKSYKQELSITLMIMFYLLTFLIISVKRNEYGNQFLQRGAYLINSIMIFVLLYILFFKMVLKKWLEEGHFKKVILCASVVFLGCLVYQIKNYRAWIEMLKYDEEETRNNEMMYLGNTLNLYEDHNKIYNIPLVSYHRIEELEKKGIFDLAKVKKNVISQPFGIKNKKVSFDNSGQTFLIKEIGGFDIKENPYLKIKGSFSGVFQSSNVQIGLVLEEDGKKSFFSIPRLKPHLNPLDRSKAQVLEFEFLFSKDYLHFRNSKISIFTVKGNEVRVCNSWHNLNNSINYDKYRSKSKIESLLDSNKFNVDTLSHPILEEAFSLNSFHEIVLNLQNLKHTNKESKYYLIFHGKDGSSFLSVLKPFDTANKKGVFYTKFEFEQVEKFLKKRNSVFELDLLVNTDGEMFVSHLESLYYFYSQNKNN